MSNRSYTLYEDIKENSVTLSDMYNIQYPEFTIEEVDER